MRPAGHLGQAHGRGGDDLSQLDPKEGVVLIEGRHGAAVIATKLPRPGRNPQLLSQLIKAQGGLAEYVGRATLCGGNPASALDNLRGVLQDVSLLILIPDPPFTDATGKLQGARSVESERPLVQASMLVALTIRCLAQSGRRLCEGVHAQWLR